MPSGCCGWSRCCASCRLAFPDVRVSLTLTNEAFDLVAYDFDVALRAGRAVDSAYIVRPVVKGSFVVVASPDFVARAGRPLRRSISHACRSPR